MNNLSEEVEKDVNALKSNKYSPWVLSLLFAGSLVFSYIEGKKHDKENEQIIEITAYNHKQLLDSLSTQYNLISKFRAENKIYQVSLEALLKDRNGVKIIETQISKSYAKLQDEIHSANDSMQSSITKDLLARHRNLPLERDK